MKTISISIDEETDIKLKDLAIEEKKAKSQVIRDMFREYLFEKKLNNLQKSSRPFALKNNLQTDDDVEAFFG